MAKEDKKKVKRPTAQKRDIRNEKKHIINKSFKASIRTTMRSFEDALKSQEKERLQERLDMVYSAVDKGVKRGIFSQNKANRLKANAHKKSTIASK